MTARLHLFIDADDTLWENNIFFERAFEEFVSHLNHSTMSAEQIRASLDEIEYVNNRIHGYGAANFARNLEQCFQRLAEREVSPPDIERIRRFGEQLANHPIHLIAEVEPTLAWLAARHHLTVCTKGHPEEQRLKIQRSGLGLYFQATAIVREKDSACYHALAEGRGLKPAGCWMIGNSPKSDINPALEAGWNAVYIPHPHTWHLERQEIPEVDGRLMVLERFADLRKHF